MLSKKTILIFVFGCLLGFSVALIIGAINLFRNKGYPLTYPKIIGDIRIASVAIDPKQVPGVGKTVVIEKKGSPFLNLLFDEEQTLCELLYYSRGNAILSIDLSSEKEGKGIEYGDPLKTTFWDIDYDGTFNAQWGNGISQIYINNSWQKINSLKRKQKQAVLKQDNQDIVYIFESGKGWVKQEK